MLSQFNIHGWGGRTHIKFYIPFYFRPIYDILWHLLSSHELLCHLVTSCDIPFDASHISYILELPTWDIAGLSNFLTTYLQFGGHRVAIGAIVANAIGRLQGEPYECDRIAIVGMGFRDKGWRGPLGTINVNECPTQDHRVSKWEPWGPSGFYGATPQPRET